MPLYEYHCPQCGNFEVIQKFSEAPLSVCPTCEREVQKQVSAPAIQFKGTGWYITDYARKSSGDATTATSKAEGGGDHKAPAGDGATKASPASDAGGSASTSTTSKTSGTGSAT